jgi:ZIP family zinc transporter
MNNALLGTFISAMATLLGAVPLFFVRRLSEKWKDVLVAFTAGIMVSATAFGLIPQSLETSTLAAVTIGLLLGLFVLDQIEKYVPHIDVENDHGIIAFQSKSLLVMVALFIHNIPEGLSTGFSYASTDESLGPMVAIAIGSQNMPEGLVLAVFLLHSKVSKWKTTAIVALTGLVEMASGMIGYAAASYIQPLIGYGLAFASGAMLFIVYKELIPETHGHGYERQATYSFIAGLLLMIYISYFFG